MQVGNIDLVELILDIAADRGIVIRISKVLHIMTFWYAHVLYSGSYKSESTSNQLLLHMHTWMGLY